MFTEEGRAAFLAQFRDLLARGVRRQVPIIFGAVQPLQLPDAYRLLSIASRLALGTNPADRMTAYEVITLVLELAEPDPSLPALANVLLARLGNFPAREFTSKSVSSNC